ncbi:MAG: YDG/SRA domain-containing protein [Thermomicrobiales bacterium]|nr:YDG/SRA domain-containing protein [Thermomicrobiales bacterium]
MVQERVFGDVPGVEEGDEFEDRKELSKAGVHRPRQAGICGGKHEGAESIVLSGGYEDDLDNGDVIIYTGHGGNVPGKATQFKDQVLDLQNMALVVSCEKRLPVRVVRGAKHNSKWSPKSGYRYGGLYRVFRWWEQRGKSGFKVYRFELRKIGSAAEREVVNGPCQGGENSILTCEGRGRRRPVSEQHRLS